MTSSMTRIVRVLTFCVNRYNYRASTISSSFIRRSLITAAHNGEFPEHSVAEDIDGERTTFASDLDSYTTELPEGELLNARSVPLDWTTQKRLLQLQSTRQPARPKQLVAAMLGAPNSGKSTLANCLVGRKICR